mmetsp:Transcript_799/g.1504  ORF Transcript_799/g.1504 Transcript_799/m.1504 type:complete len:203 (-) Transcript_799:62-670(-)
MSLAASPADTRLSTSLEFAFSFAEDTIESSSGFNARKLSGRTGKHLPHQGWTGSVASGFARNAAILVAYLPDRPPMDCTPDLMEKIVPRDGALLSVSCRSSIVPDFKVSSDITDFSATLFALARSSDSSESEESSFSSATGTICTERSRICLLPPPPLPPPPPDRPPMPPWRDFRRPINMMADVKRRSHAPVPCKSYRFITI